MWGFGDEGVPQVLSRTAKLEYDAHSRYCVSRSFII